MATLTKENCLVQEDPEIIRKKKEVRRKIFAEAIAKQEMVSQVLERYHKEREKESGVRRQTESQS